MSIGPPDARLLSLPLVWGVVLPDMRRCPLRRGLEASSGERKSDGIRRRENSNEGNDFMTTENTDTPLKADCPSAPCSPSDYDAGLLNDFGGGDVGWWQDYLRAEIGRANDYWREIHDQQNALMVRLYNASVEARRDGAPPPH
jgi:hypothetical protein